MGGPYGGGGGSGGASTTNGDFDKPSAGADGAFRIIYPGDERSFPSTRTTDE